MKSVVWGIDKTLSCMMLIFLHWSYLLKSCTLELELLRAFIFFLGLTCAELDSLGISGGSFSFVEWQAPEVTAASFIIYLVCPLSTHRLKEGEEGQGDSVTKANDAYEEVCVQRWSDRGGVKNTLINASRQSISREQYTETCSEWQSSYPNEQVPASHCWSPKPYEHWGLSLTVFRCHHYFYKYLLTFAIYVKGKNCIIERYVGFFEY